MLAFARRDHLRVRVVADRIERSLRAYNVVWREALGLMRRINPRRQTWSGKLLEKTRRRIDTPYPTAAKLWRHGREEPHRQER